MMFRFFVATMVLTVISCQPRDEGGGQAPASVMKVKPLPLYTGDFPEIRARKMVRFGIVSFGDSSSDKPNEERYDADAGELFCRHHGLEPSRFEYPSWELAVEGLVAGEVDVLIGNASHDGDGVCRRHGLESTSCRLGV